DKTDVSPVGMIELAGVVVAVAKLERIVRQLVPLFAGHLAGFAADADGRVGEESNGLGHASVPQQVWCDFGQPLIGRIEVERQGGELVDNRHGAFISAKVDSQQIAVAASAAVHT